MRCVCGGDRKEGLTYVRGLKAEIWTAMCSVLSSKTGIFLPLVWRSDFSIFLDMQIRTHTTARDWHTPIWFSVSGILPRRDLPYCEYGWILRWVSESTKALPLLLPLDLPARPPSPIYLASSPHRNGRNFKPVSGGRHPNHYQL